MVNIIVLEHPFIINYAHNLFIQLFDKLKKEFSISPKQLNCLMKKKMMVPFLKRSIALSPRTGELALTRKIMRDYYAQYGFHIYPILILLLSYFGRSILIKIPYYEKIF